MTPKQITQFLATQKQNHCYRQTRTMQTAQQPHCRIDGKNYIAFCSNDYLGLANHPEVKQAFINAANTYGVGSGAAHLINGHHHYHHQLEEQLADFTGRDQALLFSTGYMANLGTIQALSTKHDTIYQDKLNHASLIDAAQSTPTKLRRFPHNNTTVLQQWLAQDAGASPLIAVDGVFSMDGDKAPISSLASLAKQHDAWLMVDDAHGFGVLGQSGAGLLEEQACAHHVPILMATLGKALGTAGAFVAGSHELIDYLKQTARSWIYTTAMPAAMAAATLKSLELLQTENWRRDILQQRIRQLKTGANELGLSLMPSDTAIQPILLGTNQAAIEASQQLEAQGLLVTAIRPPTVPQKTARLRITLSASHTERDVEHLLNGLAQLKTSD